MREFSRGAEAFVYEPTHKQKLWFPNADLVRIEATNYLEPDLMMRYFKLRIAGLVFPENFIQVVGARIHSQGLEIYSKKAAVHPDHATLALHSMADFGDKDLNCGCLICHGHQLFHDQNDLRQKAFHVMQKTYLKAGIDVPNQDITDYCADKSGNIVFFETEAINLNKLAQYLNKNQSQLSNFDRASRLVEAYRRCLPRLAVYSPIGA